MPRAGETVPCDGLKCKCYLCEKDYEYCRARGTTKDTCDSCMTNRHRWLLKAWMRAYKGGCCQVCGYKECARSLDFHHIDPTTKLSNLGGRHCMGWDKIKTELDKCILLCRNCHNEVEHATEMLTWGHSRASILDKVDNIVNTWVPIEVPTFTRDNWKAYHPKFARSPVESLPWEMAA